MAHKKVLILGSGASKGKGSMPDVARQAHQGALDRSVKYTIHLVFRSLPAGYLPKRPTNYAVGRHTVSRLREEDPYIHDKELATAQDIRFWNLFQMDWYESVIANRSNPITKMQWVDWRYVADVED